MLDGTNSSDTKIFLDGTYETASVSFDDIGLWP